MPDIVRRLVVIGFGVFLAAIAMTFFSRALLAKLGLVPAFLLLGGIIILSILFDVVGTATLAAKRPPFHAMAASRVVGAREAIRLLKKADNVAAFCNDFMSDLLGTVGGGLAAAIVFRLSQLRPDLSELLASTVLIGLVAGLTVGGKAAWKTWAIKHSESVVLWVGRLWHYTGCFAGLVWANGGRVLPCGLRNSTSRKSGRPRVGWANKRPKKQKDEEKVGSRVGRSTED